jgi:hypothetical protein
MKKPSGIFARGRTCSKVVPKAGLEPARAIAHCPLKTACLPKFHHFGTRFGLLLILIALWQLRGNHGPLLCPLRRLLRGCWNQRDGSLGLLSPPLSFFAQRASSLRGESSGNEQAVPQTTDEEGDGQNCGQLAEKGGRTSSSENRTHSSATTTKGSRQTRSLSRLQ